MKRYIWERESWPAFTWDSARVLDAVDFARKKQYRLLGALSIGAAAERARTVSNALVATAVETSNIEGEILDLEAVRSSVARRLGFAIGDRQDDRTEGVVEMTLDAIGNFGQPLTAERLFRWNAELFPAALGEPRSSMLVGGWRRAAADPMQVLSGPIGRERVHFEAPPAERVPSEMDSFLAWFATSEGEENGLVRAAIAHLWFLTIHPFEDGNGRIARAIADMALAQDEQTRERFYSVSAQISIERRAYYDVIEAAQHGTLDVTSWVVWDIECIARAVDSAQVQVARAVRAMRFWDAWADFAFNDRQRKVLRRFLDDFDGPLNLRKYIGICGASRATAQRDITQLVDAGIIVARGAGKATSYLLAGDM